MEERRIEDHAEPWQVLRLLRFGQMRNGMGQLQKIQSDRRSTESGTQSKSLDGPGSEIRPSDVLAHDRAIVSRRHRRQNISYAQRLRHRGLLVRLTHPPQRKLRTLGTRLPP